MRPRTASIGNLLGEYERRCIVLPSFQRPYSWEKIHVAHFWRDLINFSLRYEQERVNATYFLGPMVVIEESEKITVLDGQQRLATATILIAALRDLAKQLHTLESDDNLVFFARELQKELIEKKDSDPQSFSLTLGDIVEGLFYEAIKLETKPGPVPTLRSHILIKGAYDFLIGELKERFAPLTGDARLKDLKLLRDSATKGMSLVVIAVESEDHAFEIFETLNDRGLRLSVPDLLLNLLLQRAKASQRAIVRNNWNQVVTILAKQDISRFLRHMWVSQHGDLKARGLFSDIKENLISKSTSSSKFASQCLEACEVYLEVIKCAESLPKKCKQDIQGLTKDLKVHNAMPLLLAGRQCLTDAEFTKLASYVVSIYVRHSLICGQNPTSLESAFYSAAKALRLSGLSAAKKILKALDPTDEIVKKQFENLILSRAEAGWIVPRLANHIQAKNREVAVAIANVEHIFPQNPGSLWNDEKLKPLLWHVGNLTVLGNKLNQNAQNKPFQEKLDNFYSKSNIVMSKNLAQYSKWTSTEIKNRAKYLGKFATEIWRF